MGGYNIFACSTEFLSVCLSCSLCYLIYGLIQSPEKSMERLLLISMGFGSGCYMFTLELRWCIRHSTLFGLGSPSPGIIIQATHWVCNPQDLFWVQNPLKSYPVFFGWKKGSFTPPPLELEFQKQPLKLQVSVFHTQVFAPTILEFRLRAIFSLIFIFSRVCVCGGNMAV